MRKLTLALLGASTAFALCAGAGTAKADVTRTIFDPTISQVPTNGTNGADTGNPALGFYSQIRDGNGGSAGNDYHWIDSSNGGVPGNPFNTGNVYVTWSGADVTLKINTSMPLGGTTASSKNFAFADFFFDLKPVGNNASPTWDYGLDINSGYGPSGYGDPGIDVNNRITPSSTAFTNVAGIYKGLLVSNPNFSYGNAAGALGFQQTKICQDGACDNVAGREPEVEVTGGTIVQRDGKNLEFNVSQKNGGELGTAFEYTIVLDGVNATGAWNEFRLFWGTGWCSNDSVEGTVTIPVPAALPIFAAAMAGFGFAGWRRRKTAA